MKQVAQVSGLFLILVIILKIVDFSVPTPTDVIIILLFAIYAILELVTLKVRK